MTITHNLHTYRDSIFFSNFANEIREIMAKKIYRKNSPARKRHNRRSALATALAAVALVILFSALYGSISQHGASKRNAPEELPYSYESLFDVALPDSIPQQIVHYPGFIVNFNADKHLPNYVVWELTAEECDGEEKRLNNFFKDESVAGCPDLQDYKRSGYTRGHMAPAADMKWSAEAMRASNNLTNVCPQVAAMNSGAWSTLEDNCRAWARRDSAIVIIAGPVLTDRMILDIGHNRVCVPERFFKVVFAPFANPPRAIGFVMPNSKVRGGVQNHAMTVDEVERITGYDFFSVLPDEIESQVESHSSYPLWQTLK